MAGISLKHLVGRKNESTALLASLIQQHGTDLYIEDEAGKVLLGTPLHTPAHQFPVQLEEATIGWVKGSEGGASIASILTLLAQKECEKKKLGNEVLNMYQELNLIFNFSEKLAQAIDQSSIAQVTLEEASRLIRSQGGVVALWDEKASQMQLVATSGEPLFNQKKINEHLGGLLHLILSGQSEITSDVAPLQEAGIIAPTVQSLIYAALKVKHRVMGAIVLACTEAQPYSAAHLKLLITLALQSSLAIEGSLLYEKNLRAVQEREEAMRRIYEVANRFVPYEFIRSLGHEKITDVQLGDQVEKIVTVLFSDIREYTTLAEQMTPDENFRFVCSFNEIIGPIIREHGGFINQYLGDAIMAIFPGTPTDALSAAIAMQQAVRALNERQPHRRIQIGVGMHTGSLIMGITGDRERLDAATISDTVNTASRIESLTKYYKADILLSGATLQGLHDPEAFHLRNLGRVQVKGKHEPLSLFECFSGAPDKVVQDKLHTLQPFNEGISHYLNKSFAQAIAVFGHVVDANPEDLTARLFLKNAALYISNGVPENWMGVEEMLSK
jgi:class 3 adenylate cyclase